MSLPGSLKTLFLICLLGLDCKIIENEDVDIDTLARIITFFDNNYSKSQQNKNTRRQYAAAINVPKEQCQLGFDPKKQDFLKKEYAENVKNIIYNRNVSLYEGQELIAAGTQKGKPLRHAESVLMNPPGTSPMAKLLEKRAEGCVVFYTYNSPCLDTCMNNNSNDNILGMLKTWSERKDLKAFVFKDIYKLDKENKKMLRESFQTITNYVTLYRCVSEKMCYKCMERDNINHCMQ